MRSAILLLITVYRYTLGPLLHAAAPVRTGCRYSPTCSEYTAQAVRQFGAVSGLRKGLTRFFSCH